MCRIRPAALLIFFVYWTLVAPYAVASSLGLSQQLTTSPPQGETQLPLFIVSDYLEGRDDEEIVASGRVALRQRGKQMYADWLRAELKRQDIVVLGNVRLLGEGYELLGPALYFDQKTGEGEMPDGRYRSALLPGHGQARWIQVKTRSKNIYLEDASYTTCTGSDPDWQLRARQLNLDFSRKIGTAKGARLYFMEKPVLYTPWASFPLDRQRKTGLLTPTYSASASGGQSFATPYYWNLAPNHDATLTPRFITKRGLDITGELRYLGANSTGFLQAEVLPHDRVKGKDRWGYKFYHNQLLMPHWHLDTRLERVSDYDFMNDLGSSLVASSQVSLPQQLMLEYLKEGVNFRLLGLKHQTLQNPALPVTPAYDKLPEITFSYLQPSTHSAPQFQVSSALTAFKSGSVDRLQGQRIIANPSISFPWMNAYAYFTPKIALHLSQYHLQTPKGAQRFSRLLPLLSTDAGLYLDRNLSIHNTAYQQTLEPRVFYTYIPYKNQDAFPNFDSGLADFNFSQLFLENRFNGEDRINEANQLTLAATTRLLNDQTGSQQAQLMLGQRFYFNRLQRVTMPGASPIEQRRSDILVSASVLLNSAWQLSSTLQLPSKTSGASKTRADLRYAPDTGRVLNLAYSYDRTPLAEADRIRQIDFSAQWPISRRWQGVARWNYSLKDHSSLETLGGLEYDGGCWALRLVAQRYVKSGQRVNKNIFLQLDLNDVAKLGSDPAATLKSSIFGYRTINADRKIDSSFAHEPYR